VLVAVLADVHANLEALQAVWADLTACGADQVVCLGDLVGYGPDPEAVVRFVQEHPVTCCRGNHDQAVVCPASAMHFHPQARLTLPVVAGLLSESSRAYLEGLPRSLKFQGAYGVHGFPPEDVFTYLHDVDDTRVAAWAARRPLTFVGHTHALAWLEVSGREVVRHPLAPGAVIRLKSPSLINVGSVGQPRDATRDAKYVLWHVEASQIQVRAVPYPAQRTAAKIRARGLPEAYARRLL
jgi:predicted phosphodiesterase